MNSRERVIATFRKKIPDRVPTFFRATPSIEKLFEENTGKSFECFNEYFNMDARLVEYSKTPVNNEDFTRYHPEYSKLQMHINEWGIGMVKGSSFHFDKLFHPLKNIQSIKEVENYPFPDLSADYIFEGYKEKVDKVKESGYAVIADVAPVGGTVFWPAYKLRGMEEIFVDMYDNPDILECLLDKVMAISCGLARRAAEAGADIIWMADDFGTQKDLMMSVDMWRKWFKERLYKVISSAKEVNPEAIIAFHSDGNIEKIIPDMIEIGIEVLNPVQPECMDIKDIKSKYGHKLAFWGGIGTQTTMPFGTPADVKRAVKDVIETLGEGGGLLIAPTHVIEPEVPWDNIVAFSEAVEEYGKY